jgi:glutathione S-transferase
MNDTVLHIGNKRFSSWSLRGWLACRLAGLDFREVVIPLDQPETAARIAAVSPNGRVPCLHHAGRVVWDSLAIAEHCAELAPGLWPADAAARAHARSIAAEMHAGFAELRKAMWMDVCRRWPGRARTPGALADIARIVALWRDTRARFGAGGPFLFGRDFNLADAFYAPVVTRFVTWAPELPADARAYVDAVWAHPLVAEWVAAAQAEPFTAPRYETPPPG